MTTAEIILERHIKHYNERFKLKGELPRDKDWRPVRFAVRDVILAWGIVKLLQIIKPTTPEEVEQTVDTV